MRRPTGRGRVRGFHHGECVAGPGNHYTFVAHLTARLGVEGSPVQRDFPIESGSYFAAGLQDLASEKLGRPAEPVDGERSFLNGVLARSAASNSGATARVRCFSIWRPRNPRDRSRCPARAPCLPASSRARP